MEKELVGMAEVGELLGGISIQSARGLLRRRGVALFSVGGRSLVAERSAVLELRQELEREAAELAAGSLRRRGGVARVAGALARGGRRSGIEPAGEGIEPEPAQEPAGLAR